MTRDDYISNYSWGTYDADKVEWRLHARGDSGPYHAVSVPGMTAVQLGIYLKETAGEGEFSPSIAYDVPGGQLVSDGELSAVVTALGRLCLRKRTTTRTTTTTKTSIFDGNDPHRRPYAYNETTEEH